MRSTPADDSAGWLVGDVVAFDVIADLADHVIALLVASARGGDTSALPEVLEVRRRVQDVDPRDLESLSALQARLARRVEELTP